MTWPNTKINLRLAKTLVQSSNYGGHIPIDVSKVMLRFSQPINICPLCHNSQTFVSLKETIGIILACEVMKLCVCVVIFCDRGSL